MRSWSGRRRASRRRSGASATAAGGGSGCCRGGVAGTRGAALVCNLPGSTGGAIEGLEAILSVVPHALELLAGGRPH